MNRLSMIVAMVTGLVSGVIAAEGQPEEWTPQEWTRALPLDLGVFREMNRFRSDDEPLSGDYVETQARALRRALQVHFRGWLFDVRGEGCQAFNVVEFTEPGFLGVTPPDEVSEDFEDGFQFVRAVACFPHLDATPEEALMKYTAADFRMDVASSIVSISPDGDRECVETKGYPLVMSPTRACNLIHRFVDDRMAVEHSQVVSNGDPEEYDTVFFKESLKAFVDLDGRLAFYYVNYTRASRLGRFKKPLARRAISGSLGGALETLENTLSQPKE